MRRITKRVSDIVLPLLFFVAVVILPLFFPAFLQDIFTSTESVAESIRLQQRGAPLFFVLLQIVQVIIFIIPGEVVQIAGGYLFGVIGGSLLSLAGIALGSIANWSLGYLLGARFVQAVGGTERYRKFHTLLQQRKAWRIFFLLFLIPGIPKDLLTYLGGAARVAMPPFLLLAMAGRLPALIGSTVIGAGIAQQTWGLTIALTSMALLIFLLGVLWREKIIALFRRQSVKLDIKANNGPSNDEAPPLE